MEKMRKLMSCNTLLGLKVINPAGENLGKIEEIMINIDTGHIGYAVLSHGGVVGFGDKLFAVPWGLLRLDQQKKCFITNIDKDVLDRAPGFDRNHWPDAADPYWEKSLHDYYKEKVIF